MFRLISKTPVFLCTVAIGVITLSLFRPLPPLKLHYASVSQPKVPINTLCRDIVRTHSPPAGRVIVFFHGYTNCPKQFEELGNRFYEAGFSVFIPRLPRHGYADRLTDDVKNLTAEELISFVNGAIDQGKTMGDSVSVAGLSGGGILALWAAQYRSDVDAAIAIAPSFDPYTETIFFPPMWKFFTAIPDITYWWNNELKENIPGPAYAYPKFSSRALFAFYRMGDQIYLDAKSESPKAAKTLIVTNAADAGVPNNITYDVVQRWNKAGASNLHTYVFDSYYRLNHDLIDPTQPDQNTALVYPILVSQISALTK